MQSFKNTNAGVSSAVCCQNKESKFDDVFYQQISIEKIPGLFIIKQSICIEPHSIDKLDLIEKAIIASNASSGDGYYSILKKEKRAVLTYTQKVVSEVFQNKASQAGNSILENGANYLKRLLFDSNISMGEVIDIG